MLGNEPNPRTAREAFLHELTAGALTVAKQFGLGGVSVDLEIALWREFDGVLRNWDPRPGRASTSWEDRLAVLSDAAYRVMLDRPFVGAFVDLEMEVWRQLRHVIRHNRFLSATGAKSGNREPLHLSGVLAIA